MRRTLPIILAALAAAVPAPPAHAHGEAHSGAAKAISSDRHAWGRQGETAKAGRTIMVDMGDDMRYSPSEVKVKQGDTVRFVVRNRGKTMHELVIGTREELERHAEMMRKFPRMEHDEPYMAHVAPGKREEIVWTFDRAGTFMYGCLIPGHWEAGMKGSIVVASP